MGRYTNMMAFKCDICGKYYDGDPMEKSFRVHIDKGFKCVRYYNHVCDICIESVLDSIGSLLKNATEEDASNGE